MFAFTAVSALLPNVTVPVVLPMIVRLSRAVVFPIAPENVVFPAVVAVRALAPLIVLANDRLSPLLEFSVVSAYKVMVPL
jgi:hypothetical protein